MPSGKNILQQQKVKKKSKILVIYEQGLGDSINFSCYINFLIKEHDHVYVLIQPELLSLFNNSFNCKFYTDHEDIPTYDFIFIWLACLYMSQNNHPLMNSRPFLKVSSFYLENGRAKSIA